MSRLYFSASLRYVIFSAIISVLICRAMARHRFNHNNLLREQEIRGRPYGNIKEELPNLLGSLLVLRPISHKRNTNVKLNQESPPPSDFIINTSCGRKNCENVRNYPLQLIKNLLEDQTPATSQESVPVPANADYEDFDKYGNSDFENTDFEITRAVSNFGRSFDTSSWLYPNEYPNENNLIRNKHECQILANVFKAEQEQKFKNESRDKGNLCEHQLRETNPEETVDRTNHRFTLVNDQTSIIIKGFECNAGVDCFDRSISINYKYHCETHWTYRDLCTLNNDETAIIQKTVAIADGCNCTVVKIE